MKFLNLQNKNQDGYTLLFAVLVSSLVLAIGVSILNTSRKEFLIATATRDSAAAFYAADGGLECAIYAENKQLFAPVFNPGSAFDDEADKARIDDQLKLSEDLGNYCSVAHGDIVRNTSVNNKNTFTFHARFGSKATSCAVVVVTKEDNGTEGIKTIIQSRGYNTGWDTDSNKTCSLGSAKRVERALSYVIN